MLSWARKRRGRGVSEEGSGIAGAKGMSWRPSRGQALEQEWRSFAESIEGGAFDPDATGRQAVIDLASIGSDGYPGPAGYSPDQDEPVAHPLGESASVAPLAERLTAAQQESERPAPSASPASPEEIHRLMVEFRRSAVSLAVGSDDADALAELGRQGGAALVSLAGAGAGEALTDVLRPDLAAGDATWTVACYQIGDLSPSSLRDFSAPVEAVNTLSDCENPAHVAAELIVTNGDGLRWTAMVRSGSSVAFQLLGSATSGSTPGDAGASLRAARNRWEDRLLSWAANPGMAPEPAVTEVASAVTDTQMAVPLPIAPGFPLAGDVRVEARLAALEKHAVASATELLELRGEVRALRRARRDARKETKRMRRRADALGDEVSRLRQELAAASQRASLSELGLSALTATVVSSVHAPAESAAVVVVPQPTRVPSQVQSGAVIRSEWAVQRLRAWCDRRLARSGFTDPR